MITIKNIRPGILIVPDAGLKLRPGQVMEVAAPSKQTERLIASGHLARAGAMTTEPGGTGKTESGDGDETKTTPTPDPAPDLSKLSAQQAIAKVAEMDDPERIKECIEAEKRRSVLDALMKKRGEVAGGAE